MLRLWGLPGGPDHPKMLARSETADVRIWAWSHLRSYEENLSGTFRVLRRSPQTGLPKLTASTATRSVAAASSSSSVLTVSGFEVARGCRALSLKDL